MGLRLRIVPRFPALRAGERIIPSGGGGVGALVGRMWAGWEATLMESCLLWIRYPDAVVSIRRWNGRSAVM